MNKRGFTLIEVLVTVAILGILAMVATTNFSGTNNNKNLETFARQLAADLQYVQQKVMTGGEFSDDFSTDRDIITYGMQFNATGYRVVWVHEVIVSGTVTYTQGAEKTVRLPTGVSWDMNNAYTAPYIDPIIPFAFDTTYPSINQAKTINNKPMFQINGSMKNSDTPPVRVLPYGAIPAPPEPLPANYVEYWTVAKINNTNGKTKFVVVVTATGAIMIRDLLP